MVSYLLNIIFKLKQTIGNVYSIIPEAWNIQAFLGFTPVFKSYRYSGIHVAMLLTSKNILSLPECSPVLHDV